MIKTLRSLFILILLFLCIPSYASAQRTRQSAADKSWNIFWVQFSTAVKNKDTKSLRRLMSSEKDFFSGGGGESRDEWLQFMKEQNLWGEFRESVSTGTKKWSCIRPCRATRSNHLIFQYISGSWRWTGLMGD